MKTYRVWNIFTSIQCTIEAPNSFEARKLYAARYGVAYGDCAARRIWDDDAMAAGVAHSYSREAVEREIRRDKRIGAKEAKAIHALLKGRT
jgi:hypothetical protein